MVKYKATYFFVFLLGTFFMSMFVVQSLALNSREATLEVIIPNVSIDGKIQLRWTIGDTVPHTETVQRRVGNGFFGDINILQSTSNGINSWTDTLTESGDYAYRIKSMYREGGRNLYYYSIFREVRFTKLEEDIIPVDEDIIPVDESSELSINEPMLISGIVMVLVVMIIFFMYYMKKVRRR
ncbi:hypothetical protein LCGC14_1017280 [marine sediment metagenome]|uniref:Uncharacterized protein n=1 Tax=marine sediment metagenome TaxID=412755 RepID=A0A0F9N336_9ZZZZ